MDIGKLKFNTFMCLGYQLLNLLAFYGNIPVPSQGSIHLKPRQFKMNAVLFGDNTSSTGTNTSGDESTNPKVTKATLTKKKFLFSCSTRKKELVLAASTIMILELSRYLLKLFFKAQALKKYLDSCKKSPLGYNNLNNNFY